MAVSGEQGGDFCARQILFSLGKETELRIIDRKEEAWGAGKDAIGTALK